MFSDDSATEEGIVAGESEKNSIYASTLLEQMEEDEEKVFTESVDTEDDLMDDNVQTFINMALLQKKFEGMELNIGNSDKIHIEVEPGKKLLLLDMDETLLHAATLNDIFDQ